MDIEKSNVMIAKWMGAIPISPLEHGEATGSPELWYYETPPKWCSKHQGKLFYNESWDWLMPVLEKIERLPEGFYIDMRTTATYIVILSVIDNVPDKTIFIQSFGTRSRLELTYRAIVEFLEWYTTKTPSNKDYSIPLLKERHWWSKENDKPHVSLIVGSTDDNGDPFSLNLGWFECINGEYLLTEEGIRQYGILVQNYEKRNS